MKYQVLFSLKNNDKVFMNVVCCSRLLGALRINIFLNCLSFFILSAFLLQDQQPYGILNRR